MDCARPRCKRVVHFNRLKPTPLGNVPIAERVVNQEEHMEHSGDSAVENEEEELEFTEMDQPVIIPDNTVEVNHCSSSYTTCDRCSPPTCRTTKCSPSDTT